MEQSSSLEDTQSRKCLPFIEYEDSLPRSQQPACGPYQEPDNLFQLSYPVCFKSMLILYSCLRLGIPT
jgi:hypothetical protein